MIGSLTKNVKSHTVILPVITNLSENVGSSEAYKLTIKGSGFGTQKSLVDIRVAGVSCPITII